MNKSVKTILILLAGIIIVGASAGVILYNKKDADLSRKRPDFVMTPADLFIEFSNDEALASEKYIGKVVELSGNIANISPGADGLTTNIYLETGDPLGSIICTIQNDKLDSELASGNLITLRAECSGMLMDVLLNNASIIKVGQ